MGKTKIKPHHFSVQAKSFTNSYNLQAAQRNNLMSSFIPVIFQNPYNDNDYDIIEDAYLNTIAGKVIDEKVNFIVAGGIEPVFELRDPVGDDGKDLEPEQIQEALESYDGVKRELIKIDQRRTIDFNQRAKDAIRNMLVFGRSVLAFEPDGASIPSALKPIHPRDLGRVFVHQLDWSLSSVHAFLRRESIHEEEMIYFVNMQNSPARRGMWYGFSEMQRVISQARTLRKILEFDLPEIAESLWAGYGLLRVDNEGLSADEKKKDLQTIRDGFQPGMMQLVNGKKDEIEFMKFDTDPRLAELLEAADKLERDIIGNSGIPGPLVGREEEANMATLFGKIRLFGKGPVRSVREDTSKIIGKQWYEHNLTLIDPEASRNIRVSAQYKPVVVESWRDNIDVLIKIKQLFPGIPDLELLKLADLEELKDKLEPTEPLDPLALREQSRDNRDVENNENLKRIAEAAIVRK